MNHVFKMAIFSVSLNVLLNSCGSSNSLSHFDGSFETSLIAHNFRLYEPASIEKLSSFIIEKSLNQVSPERATILGKKVNVISTCFKIDQRVFAGLIARESQFLMGAVSPTGAAGLTQMTGIGLTEVNDQLGKRGDAYARKSTIEYFQKIIRQCVLPTSNWVNLWERQSTNAGMKEVLKKDSNTAIIYGAVLLKVLLSSEKTRNPSNDMETTYRNALMRYNGDPAEKERYQRIIMNFALSLQ